MRFLPAREAVVRVSRRNACRPQNQQYVHMFNLFLLGLGALVRRWYSNSI